MTAKLLLGELLDEFRSPGSEYRGKPFWAWNGKLEPEELRRQVRMFKKMGLGGAFMHSRVGLATAYLSDEWFECVAATADEAEKQGMEAWLYDEDRWPSGAAGGIVTRAEAYRMRALKLQELADPAELTWDDATVAAFTAKVEGSAVREVERIASGEKPASLAEGEVVFVFRVEVSTPSSWYNGYTYLDTMNPEAVREFIRVTHDAYAERTGEQFGSVVPGIFTDEPNYGRMLSGRDDPSVVRLVGSVPWTGTLPEVFCERYGYDLLDHLPEVFLDLADQEVSRARVDYHDCVTFMFVDAFARQIGEWCDEHGLLHTGHVLAEQTLSSQTSVVGSAMRFYEYMQAPGLDILTEHRREYDTAKQVSSVARQFGRKWRLTETYGCSGWDFPFEGHKAVGDWQAALGINLRCQHLAYYTMEGQAKRDYPAAISYQSPWCESYPKVEDYFARIHATMTCGVEVRDCLVVHPVESMWALCRLGWREDPRVSDLDRKLTAVRDSLLVENVDFDYGDEDILARHGRVEKDAGGAALHVAQAAYRAVVVPPTITMRRTTLDLLSQFHEKGGVVVFAGDPPGFVNAEKSGDVAALAEKCGRAPESGPEIARTVESVARRVSITEGDSTDQLGPVLHLLRGDDGAFYLFVANTGHEFAKSPTEDDIPVRERTLVFPDVRIRGFEGCEGAPVELDPDTGRAFAADAKKRGAAWEIRTELPRLGSRIFVVPKQAVADAPALEARPKLEEVRRQPAGSRWGVELSEPNCLVLDRPRFRIGEGEWREADEILRVDFAARDALGIPRRGGQMVQPWARRSGPEPKKVRVELAYSFDVEKLPEGELHLAVERPALFSARLNGKEIDTSQDSGFWVDRSLRLLPADAELLREGENELLLGCDYDENHPGLEIVYLLGSFGTRVEDTKVALTSLPEELDVGDRVEQGLAFYGGNVAYMREVKLEEGLKDGERLFVSVPGYRGVAVRVLVDRKEAGVIAWAPDEVEVTDLVKGGEGNGFELTVEVIGHRRNSHGPLHHSEKWPRWTGPSEFVTSGESWIDGYQLVPCGLLEEPSLVVKM